MNKILLINPRLDIVSTPQKQQPVGLCYIAAVLLQKNYDVDILDANLFDMEADRVAGYVQKLNPDYVGIYTALFNFNESREIATKIRDNCNCKVIVGGPATPYHWPELLENADYVVIGEGEITVLELIQRLEVGQLSPDIPGIAFMKNGVPIKTIPRPFIENLDTIPFPAYHLLPELKKYHMRERRNPACVLITSRGCPYRCKFCFHGIFGHEYRMRSAENVISELKYLVERFGVRQIAVEDDNATLSKERTRKIFQMVIDEKLDLLFDFQNGIRVDTLDYELLSLMHKAGTYIIAVAPESGDPEILKMIGKGFSLKKVKEVVNWCKKIGIITQAFFIIGFPWENEDNIRNTINFAIELDPDVVQFANLTPFKGTEVYDYAKENGLIVNDTPGAEDYFGGIFKMRTKSLNTEQLSKLYSEAYRKFYLRPGKLSRTCVKLFPRNWYELRHYFNRFQTALKNAI